MMMARTTLPLLFLYLFLADCLSRPQIANIAAYLPGFISTTSSIGAKIFAIYATFSRQSASLLVKCFITPCLERDTVRDTVCFYA